MDIRQLRNVLAVIEYGSLGRAADALSMTQPALTKSVQRLEQELGVTLFHRDSLGMRPTVYAECLKAHAQKLDKGLHQALEEIHALRQGASGVVTIGASPLTAGRFLPRAVARFSAARPDVKVRVVSTTANPIRELMAGDYDFLVKVLNQSGAEAGAREQLLFDDKLVFIVRAGHPLTRLSKVTVADLDDYAWVVPPEENLHRRRLDDFLRAHGRSPRVAVESTITTVITEVARRTDHIGLTARIALHSMRGHDPALVPLEFDSPILSRPIGLVWREDVALNPVSLLLIAEIKETVATNVAEFSAEL